MTAIAAKVIASAPFGHSVTIQKSSAAPIATKARPALTRAGDGGPGRILDEQSQPVQRARNARQGFGRLVSE